MIYLAPVAPHLAEECWNLLGKDKSIFENPQWFSVDVSSLVKDTVLVVVQVNGKVRAKIEIPAGLPENEVKKIVFSDGKVKINIESPVQLLNFIERHSDDFRFY